MRELEGLCGGPLRGAAVGALDALPLRVVLEGGLYRDFELKCSMLTKGIVFDIKFDSVHDFLN